MRSSTLKTFVKNQSRNSGFYRRKQNHIMDYGRAIRTIRAAKGITQKQLSVLTDLDPSYISRIEKNERIPTLETLEKIAKKTKIPFYLLTLLASGEEDLKQIPNTNTYPIAHELLNILVAAHKKGQ